MSLPKPNPNPEEIRFRHVTDETGNDTYTLWPEKTYEDGWIVGWCPELDKTMIVNPKNVVAS